MGITYNPFTGQLDYTGGSGGGSTTPYSSTFVTGDWVVNGADYDLTFAQGVHNKGLNPQIQVFALNGIVYEEVSVFSSIDSVSGLITIRVSGTPDLRFNGKIVVE